jgi:hypothetical protein
MRSDLVDLTLHIHHETDAAILVSDTGEEKRAVWVPRSQVEIEKLGPRGNEAIVTMPQWLAIEKEFV